ITEYLVYFFQAEDGIRDYHVNGVQTCALPISECLRRPPDFRRAPGAQSAGYLYLGDGDLFILQTPQAFGRIFKFHRLMTAIKAQIGRASCRERDIVGSVAVSLCEY